MTDFRTMTDFRQMIFDIAKATKLKDYQIADRLNIPPSTLSSIKNAGRDPLYSHGKAIEEFHRRECDGLY